MTFERSTNGYVVMRKTGSGIIVDSFDIYEYNVDFDGIVSYSTDPAAPVGETLEELRADLRRMLAAFDGTIYDYDTEQHVSCSLLTLRIPFRQRMGIHLF